MTRNEYIASTGMTNIAFACALQLTSPASCVDILLSTDRAPEAALFSRTYAPSQTSRAVDAWKKDLNASKKVKLANAIADPEVESDRKAFEEGWEAALSREEELKNGTGVLQIDNGEEEVEELLELENGVESLQIELPVEEVEEDEEDFGKFHHPLAVETMMGVSLTFLIWVV